MRRLVWGSAMVGVFAGVVAFGISGRGDSGGQGLSALLAMNAGEASQPAKGDTSAVVRRLYEGPERDTWGTDVSPDGRFLTQTDRVTGDLAVLDLLTGQLRRVTDTGSWERTGTSDAEMSVYSPDGSEIAYLWFNEDQEYEIRVIGVDGSNPRLILPPDSTQRYWWPGLLDWSPDGEQLLLALDPGLDAELALLSIRDGSLRVLMDTPIGMAVDFAAFSPDGRYIAFEQPSKPATGEEMTPDGDVFLIPVGGGEKVPLLRGPASDELIGWEPDGRSVVFKSDRGLTEGVWRLPVDAGRAAGEPELIRGDLWRLKRIGMSGGRVYYGIRTEAPQLYTVGIDLQNGRIVSPPTPVEEATELRVSTSAWSPDGRQLAYVRARSPGANSNVQELVIRSLPGDPPRIMPLPVPVVNRIWWAPDGRSLILKSPAPPEDPDWRGLFNFDLETGSYAPIKTSEGVPYWATLTRDRRIAYYDGRLYNGDQIDTYPQKGENRPDALMARNLETGEEREVARLESRPTFGGLALSPDEKWVARFNRPADAPDMRGIDLISTESGEVREIHRYPYSPGGIMCGNPLWSPDGKYLVYGVANPASNGCTLQRLPIEGGGPTPIGDLPSHSGNRLSPDGRRLAFIHGVFRGELWVMEYGQGQGRE
ncbi:MAG: hypothetical protein Q8N53_15615 [Longimicrobiales bacterium]|nr:hypothetical protein [Longimicrobiales bacterium]